MKTKQITKLLAVVAIATSPLTVEASPGRRGREGAGHAGAPRVERATPRPRPDVRAGARRPSPPTPTPTPTPTPRPLPPVTEVGLAGIAVARPRTMPSGAPACGNVGARATKPVDCGRGTPTGNTP
jgi:hypothetical protein